MQLRLLANCAELVVVVSAATAVLTTVQKFIVVVSAATAVATTVQNYIVVVYPATLAPTTVQKFIVDEEEEEVEDEGKKITSKIYKIQICIN